MGDRPSESWTGKGARRGIRITPTCPFCQEPLVVWDMMGDDCSKCGRDSLEAEDIRIAQGKITEHWKRFWEERERKVIELFLTGDEVERERG